MTTQADDQSLCGHGEDITSLRIGLLQYKGGRDQADVPNVTSVPSVPSVASVASVLGVSGVPGVPDVPRVPRSVCWVSADTRVEGMPGTFK